jgi:hypothetical protein
MEENMEIFELRLIFLAISAISFAVTAVLFMRNRHYYMRLLRSYRHLWREWRCERARRYLRKYDHQYSMQEASCELVRRRSAARKAGIGPADPAYPDLYDVIGGG